ncbi:MAG: hypothetical protein AMXMBFR84_37200 [Candidatus Hydrogenedentota bacterium]
MRQPLLDILRCPVCGTEGGFELENESVNKTEVYSGHIRCVCCRMQFPIVQGCCDLLPHPSQAVAQERAAQATVEKRTIESSPEYARMVKNDPEMRDFILSLPQGYPDMAVLAPVVEYAVSKLKLTGSETVLDIGAGMCWTTAAFAAKGCKAVAIDISTLYMPRSRFFCNDGRYFDRIIADMTEFPVATGKFDIVFANAAVHHSPDLAKTIEEMARVLKPGGRLVLANEPVAGRYERKRIREFGRDEIVDGFNENIYRLRQWKELLIEFGLKPRFEIPSAGIAEKTTARLRRNGQDSVIRKLLLRSLQVPLARHILMIIARPFALRFYPFNVLIWATKNGRTR